MAILNYTTKVPTAKTVGEIISLLSKNGARKILQDMDVKGEIFAITFALEIKGDLVFYALPCNWQGVLKVMQKDDKIANSFCNQAQALRVSWRIIKDWIAAQLAIVQADLASLPQIFLPYAITRDGKTLYDQFSNDPQRLLN